MIKRILLICIELYRSVRSGGLVPPVCRFWPSCSRYLQEAVEIHGTRTGLRLGLRRVVRCNPWTKGGIDHVPAGNLKGP